MSGFYHSSLIQFTHPFLWFTSGLLSLELISEMSCPPATCLLADLVGHHKRPWRYHLWGIIALPVSHFPRALQHHLANRPDPTDHQILPVLSGELKSSFQRRSSGDGSLPVCFLLCRRCHMAALSCTYRAAIALLALFSKTAQLCNHHQAPTCQPGKHCPAPWV